MNVLPESPPKTDNLPRFDFNLDDWLFNLVELNHPEWTQSDGSCPECEAEIKRMRKRADSLKVLEIDSNS